MFLLSKPLGAYLLGENYAKSMGVNVKGFRVALILLSSILSACVTAFAGPISFVGIAVPHITRLIFRTSRPMVLIPATFLTGSVFCLACDLIARTAFSPTELTISTVTSVLGAPRGDLADDQAQEEWLMYFETQKLSVGYHRRPLIEDIDIGIWQGGILCLIGPNGSGKSTILRSITRHLTKLGGVVAIGGRDLDGMSDKELARHVSVVLTDRIEPELMTCWEVVAAGRYPYTNHFRKALQGGSAHRGGLHGPGQRSGAAGAAVYRTQRRPEAAGAAGPGPVPAAGGDRPGRAHQLSGHPPQDRAAGHPPGDDRQPGGCPWCSPSTRWIWPPSWPTWWCW